MSGKSLGVWRLVSLAGTSVSVLFNVWQAYCWRRHVHSHRQCRVLSGEEDQWKGRIEAAIDQQRLTLHAQPIEDLQQGGVYQYELLLRMVGDEGELVPPGQFLAVAERSDLIHSIDRWVVCNAIHEIAAQHRQGRTLCLEVNLSGKAFNDDGLLSLIEHELAAHEVDPRHLVLEITETAAVENIERAQVFIDTLKRIGCRFAIDDFGTGFSSFQYLKDLPVDYLKIDGSFIKNLPRDPVDQQLVQAIVQVASCLGKKTIAEFVGDEETVHLLRTYGVDYAQGFYIGRPGQLAKHLERH